MNLYHIKFILHLYIHILYLYQCGVAGLQTIRKAKNEENQEKSITAI